jgi:hypothetical protein
MDDALSLNLKIKPVGDTAQVNPNTEKSNSKPVSGILRGIASDKPQSKADVQAALGAALNLGRPATDAEVVATLDQCAQNLEQLGPGARSNFVEKYNNLSSI